MMTLKVDWDGKWEDYVKIFKFRYEHLFKSKKLIIKDVTVYQTKKGYHIYYDIQKVNSYKDIYIFEALLGDDLNRVMYNVCENVDILYKIKRNYEQVIRHDLTIELMDAVGKINKMKFYQTLNFVL